MEELTIEQITSILEDHHNHLIEHIEFLSILNIMIPTLIDSHNALEGRVKFLEEMLFGPTESEVPVDA